MNKIHTIIFDIGNVLMKFDQITYMQALLQDEETIRHVDSAIWLSGYWDDLDRGLEPEQVFSRMYRKEPEYRREIELTLENIAQCMDRKEYAIPWIRELKERGYQVLYLSNYSHFVMDAKPEVLDFIPYMDGGIFSCDVKMIKPEERIYRRLCETYGLDPEECVFLDDRKENLDPARKIGLQTILFENYPQAKAALDQFL